MMMMMIIDELLEPGTTVSSFMCCLGICLWFKVLEEYVPLHHLHQLRSNFNAVTWSIMDNMADDSVSSIEYNEQIVNVISTHLYKHFTLIKGYNCLPSGTSTPLWKIRSSFTQFSRMHLPRKSRNDCL
jgi:hypothetical protein